MEEQAMEQVLNQMQDTAADQEPEKIPEPKWYVVHTYSGYENKVAKDLETMVENRNLQDLICKIEVPVEIEYETKKVRRKKPAGTKRPRKKTPEEELAELLRDEPVVEEPEFEEVLQEVEHKKFPGYVMVKMSMTDPTWYVVRNTRGVTGFVGESTKPLPLSDEEVVRLGLETGEKAVAAKTVDFKVGDTVEIVADDLPGGILQKGGIAEVVAIDLAAGTVKIKVNLFGSETTAELGLDQVGPLL